MWGQHPLRGASCDFPWLPLRVAVVWLQTVACPSRGHPMSPPGCNVPPGLASVPRQEQDP